MSNENNVLISMEGGVSENSVKRPWNYFKFLFGSSLGILLFFIPVTFNKTNSIVVDHLVTLIKTSAPMFSSYFCLSVMVVGAVLPFVDQSWNKNAVNLILSMLKVLGAAFAGMFLFNIGPAVLLDPKLLPFIFNRVVIPAGLVVPIGATLLIFITNFGLLEFCGVLLKPFMRKVYNVPGSAALTAVTEFVGSFSVGIFMANILYKEGKYTKREVAIVVTGFATVSATFMVIVARTLDLMSIWTPFFLTALFVTFFTTAVVSRLWPLCKIDNTYYNGIDNSEKEDAISSRILKTAFENGLLQVNRPIKLGGLLLTNFKEGLLIVSRLLPSIMAIGSITLVLVNFTPVFDYLGMLFYPITALLGLPDALLVAKATALGGAEMFMPTVITAAAGTAVLSKFVVGIVSISTILFFTGSIPVILTTDIDLSIGKILAIMVERMYIAILLATLIGRYVLQLT